MIGSWLAALRRSARAGAGSNRSEWSQWRGPNRDGISAETGLLKQWPAGGPPRVWQATGAGTGYSSFSSSSGRLYTSARASDIEYVMAFDRATGASCGRRRTAAASATSRATAREARRPPRAT